MKLPILLTLFAVMSGLGGIAQAKNNKQAGVNVWTYTDGVYAGKAVIKTDDGKRLVKSVKVIVNGDQLQLSSIPKSADESKSILYISNGAIKNKTGEVVGACQSYVCTYVKQGFPIDGDGFAGNTFDLATIIFGDKTIRVEGSVPIVVTGQMKSVPTGFKRLNSEIFEGPAMASLTANLKLVRALN